MDIKFMSMYIKSFYFGVFIYLFEKFQVEFIRLLKYLGHFKDEKNKPTMKTVVLKSIKFKNSKNKYKIRKKNM